MFRKNKNNKSEKVKCKKVRHLDWFSNNLDRSGTKYLSNLYSIYKFFPLASGEDHPIRDLSVSISDQ